MMIPFVSAWSAALDVGLQGAVAQLVGALTAPTRSITSSNEMFSSCWPSSALVAGVNSGSTNLLASDSPGGSAIPHTLPVFW